MNKIINIFKHKGVKNSIWIIMERVIQMLVSFVITMISARYLGPSNYGILNYGISFVTFFSAIVKLGLDGIIVKELIDNPEKEGHLLGTSMVFRLLSSFVSIILIIICIIILKPNNNLILLVTTLQSLVLIFQALTFLDFWFQSKLKSKYVSLAKIVGYIIASSYKLFLLISKADIKWFALSNVLDYLLICIFLYIFYKKNKGPKLKVDWELGKSLIKKSYHFILSSLMVVLYTQIDKIMIGSMLDETNVGIYSAAVAIHSAYCFLPEAIVTSARPTLFTAKKNNKRLYLKRLKQTFCLVFWVCVLLSLIITLSSSFIINVIYGEKYILAKIPLLILIWAVPFSNIGNVRSIWIVGENKQKYVKKYLIFSATINIILNYFFILKYNIIGAAIATIITEIFSGLIAPLIYKETRAISKIALDGIFFRFNNNDNL